MNDLIHKMAESDTKGASEFFKKAMARGEQAWNIHLSLFPVAQRVLNPPYINPHFPKLHAVCRGFLPYLREDEIPALVGLEINEYTRRPKFEEIPKAAGYVESMAFPQIEAAIATGDREKTAASMYAYVEQKGKIELAHRLLLLGSGYMDVSLGHSVSCTAFILLEMIERYDQSPWPAVAALADYFCKGRFHATPELRGGKDLVSEAALSGNLLRATNGDGIVNLHHTITFYAIHQVKHLLTEAEFAHLIACWIEFMGNKPEASPATRTAETTDISYSGFLEFLSRRDTKSVLSILGGLISTPEGRKQVGSYLIKGVCDVYEGSYDPHFLTGLASSLWVVNHYWDKAPLPMNALRQYLNHFSSR